MNPVTVWNITRGLVWTSSQVKLRCNDPNLRLQLHFLTFFSAQEFSPSSSIIFSCQGNCTPLNNFRRTFHHTYSSWLQNLQLHLWNLFPAQEFPAQFLYHLFLPRKLHFITWFLAASSHHLYSSWILTNLQLHFAWQTLSSSCTWSLSLTKYW